MRDLFSILSKIIYNLTIMKKTLTYSLSLLFIAMLTVTSIFASAKNYTVFSPDGNTEISINIDQIITYSVLQDGEYILSPSPISMTITDGSIWGVEAKVLRVTRHSVDENISTHFYKQSQVKDNYNDIRITFAGDWALEFRAYDDGVAYRFCSKRKGNYEIINEQASFNFSKDFYANVPYVRDKGLIEKQITGSFENTYTHEKISKLDKSRLIFLPLNVELSVNKKITISESDLRDYPGMYIRSAFEENSLKGFFAPLRNKVQEHSGYNNLQVTIKSRYPFIARVNGPRTFPWRMAIISKNDVELANSTMTYKLATPNLIGDVSWVKPGKVAWDWWNDWNLEGVDFKTGVNNQTYKYYIDFAAKNGIEYVILDEGWAVNKIYDLMKVVPEINIKDLVDYGKERGVGIILWAGYYAFDRDMENVCKYYSGIGVKGFKVDFMNGDDQTLVDFNERTAKMCAKYHLLVDLHGSFKPAGIQRTYPNILNVEGVNGLEQMKWQPTTYDQVSYDVQLPYIRMIAGSMDYTQGAMNNALRLQYYPSNSRPMSQGTRCHQFAEYIVFFSPLCMLCDSPTNYEKNPISTAFIASIPTIWDESKTIQGEMGKYIVTARRRGEKWYIGGLNNWTARDITLNIDDIARQIGVESPATTAIAYVDGINADKIGTDFKKKLIKVTKEIKIHMAPGGGFVLQLE